jgi:apolipoprotein N-acyltransferase
VSLVFSALLTAAALRSPDHHWLAWISFLPLFAVVRSLRPPAATLAGGLWGGCLYLLCTAGPTPAVDTVAPAIGPSAWLLALLIVIPAVYVGLAARPARAIGFNLLTLALGWTLLEVVLHLYSPSRPHEGLLTGSEAEAPQFHWLARLLGYVVAAFLVACANASLVGILSGARLSFPACRSWAGSPIAGACAPSQVSSAIQSWTLRQAHPRAPPVEIAAVR